jgi:anti-sigma B factor antagonist
MSAGPPLALEHEPIAAADVLRVRGEVDASNAEQLEQALLGLGKELVVVDLSGVGYIDSAGVRALDRGLGAVLSRGGTFRAVAPTGGPARLTLRVSGYDASAVAEDLEAALTSPSMRMPPTSRA